MTEQIKEWEEYEKTARHVIEQLKSRFGISNVEGKQKIEGSCGTTWEIDAKAMREGNENFLIVEARRRRTSRIRQEDMAAVAFRILDTGASGGIVVSPLPLQRGAEIVARSAGIKHLRLEDWSTAEDYLAELMGQTFHGMTARSSLVARDYVEVEILNRDDKV